jgi:acyl-CoA dehydrogenase
MLWPFFDESHRRLATEAEKWAASLEDGEHPSERAAVDARCREFVARLGKAGLLRHCLRAADGGATADFDARSICLLRQILAHQDGLADFAFAMQGLGSAPLSLAGSERLRACSFRLVYSLVSQTQRGDIILQFRKIFN